MKRIIFESAPEFILLCIVLGVAYAAIQYFRLRQRPWSANLNRILFVLRAILASFIAFLLLGPIIKHTTNVIERPNIIILHDNSASVRQGTDSLMLQTVKEKLAETEELLANKGYVTTRYGLEGVIDGDITYDAPASDIHSALRKISNRYEGRKIAGVVLISDGIYNSGLSPLHASYNFPVTTIGVGDTTENLDVGIRNIAYNKIAYEGNKFPLHVEVQVKNLDPQNITVSLLKRGKVIDKQTKASKKDDLITFEFQPLAEEQGIQKLDIQAEIKNGEQNTRNNHSSVFVEVVEGKKKILVVAPAPHPDIKALREVVEKNSNYEFLLHIPGVNEQPQNVLRPDNIDLAIFHQSPDSRARTNAIFQRFANTSTSLFLILGRQSDLQMLARQKMPIGYETLPRDFDEVMPVTNQAFSNFSVTTETNTILASYPPVYVHFGKVQVPPSSSIILFQRVGSVTTSKPLLTVDQKDARKIGVMFGEGLWRWRLDEFGRTENTLAFDEVFGKLIQFLSTTEDKRKFRSYPVKQEFSDMEPVVFESQVYNDIFEPVYGNTIAISLTGENGFKSDYTYTTSPGNIRYQIGGLTEGVYRYRASTTLNGKREEVRGEFAVVEQQAELLNLTADFDLLRKISNNTGGEFYTAADLDRLQDSFSKARASSTIHSEESYDSMINLTWIFWLLMLIVSVEWFLRKYHGSY